MTSAPVKDVGFLMNFVGSMGTRNITSTGGASTASGFGDAMSKAQGKDPEASSASQLQTRQETSRAQEKSAVTNSRREAVKAGENTEKTSESKVDTENQKAIEEAGQEIVQGIAEELGVTPEEVSKAMEELGLSVYSLFDTAQLSQLVLQLSGEADISSLLTDETLFQDLQNLIQLTDQVKNELMQDMNVNPQQFEEMIEQGQRTALAEQTADTVVQSQNETQPPSLSVVSVEKTVGVENETQPPSPNVEKTVGIESPVGEKPLEEQSGQQAKGNAQGGSQESKGEGYGTGNPLLETLLQSKTPAAEAPIEQNSSIFNRTTQEIMNQIMDYMKIQLKPDMNQLEMQLHPESLGTVHVQLTTKGGEVTAQFQVQNETVKAAIESQIVELKDNLKDQGVKVESVEVTVDAHGFESNLWQGQGREENAASQGSRKTPRRLNLNELDGLFEEEASEEEVLAARMMEMNGNTVDYTV